MVRVSCRCRCSPGVRIKRSWKSGADIVSNVSNKAGREGIFGQLQRVRIDEGTKSVIIWRRLSPWGRMGIIARCSNRIIGIVAIIIGKAEG